MKIQRLPGVLPQRFSGVAELKSAPSPQPPPTPNPDINQAAARKTGGAVGAVLGLMAGRALPAAGAAAGGWQLGQSLGGAWGGVAGAAVGFYAGIKLEQKTRAGRLLGGMLGGAMGTALGAAAGALGWQPSETLAGETRGFSLTSLPSKLLNPNYTSHHRLTPEQAAPGMALVQPGDVIITSDDEDFKLEWMQKLIGASADWTHAALVDENLQTLDIYISSNKPVQNPLGFIFGDNHHACVLRPRYRNQESIQKTLDYMRDKFDKITYDDNFDLASENAQYCQEYIYKGLAHGAPEIRIPTRKVPLWGKELITSDEIRDSPDMDLIWSTGSDFKLNFLSKVT